MIGHRKLTSLELSELADRLENVDESISRTYRYPLSDLIANLREYDEKAVNEVEDEDGFPKYYYLQFRSPPLTWQLLCGRAGIYKIDASTLKVISFQLTEMN